MSASISRIRIFAADDDPIAPQWIAGVVGVQPDVVLAGETSDGGRSNRQLRTHQARNASRWAPLLRLIWPRGTLAATLSCYIASLWLLASPAYALDPNKRITQYVHSAWRVRDGSSPTGAYGIAQTSDGFLWFISGDMQIFDGVRFTSWDGPPNGGSITKGAPFGQIVNAFGDHAGGLWVFGLRGIVHLKGRVVTSQFDLEGLRTLQNFSEDNDGSIWVVRGNNSISDLPLCHITDRAVKCFGKADGIPISPVNSLLADGNGGFWLGGQTAVVHWHDGVSETYPIEALKSNVGQTGIAGLARGPNGSLWVGILAPGPGRGLGRLVNGMFQPFVTPSFEGSRLAVRSMIFDRDRNLWVGTNGNGMFRIRGNLVDHYGRADGLAGDSVGALFEDREGILWAATPGEGIDKFRDPPIASFSIFEGLGNDLPQGVLASRDGTIWVANLGSLDHIEKNGTISSIRTRDGLPGNRVASMLEDSAGNTWVGVDDGLYLFKNGRFRPIPGPDREPLGLVVGLAEDVDRDIWAECFSKPPKLVRIRDFQVGEEFPASRVPIGRILAPDPQGGIWIGTLKGDLALFRKGVLKEFPINAKADLIRQIIADSDGSVLAGSADGLIGVREGKVQRMTTKNGLPCNFVTSFIEDRDRNWWLYTDCGIVEIPDSELKRWWKNPEAIIQIRVLDESDGARAGRPVFNSAAYSSDGRVWFAQGNVVQMIDPARLSQKALPAMAHIQSLSVDRKEFPASGNLKLSPHPRDVQIDYTSPELLIPQKVKFRYRIDGYDRDWHEAGTRRQAFYTDLPPGNYSFRVIACNSDGVWNNRAAKLDFSIAPAYYQTNWFRGTVVAAFFLALWGLYQLRLRQIAREYNAHLEGRVDERLRVARDLHDTLLQTFQGLIPVFQAARNLLPLRADRAAEVLDEGLHDAADAIVEGRNAIQNLRAEPSQERDLGCLLNTTGQELAQSPEAEGSAPAFRVVVEGSRLPLAPLLQDEIYRIGREMLRNAFRHAHAARIEAEIRYERDMFRLRIRDDGKGMDSSVLKQGARTGHWGLAGMHERAKKMGGRLKIWSEPGAGTEAELTVPARIAYAKFSTSNGWLARLGRRLRLTAPKGQA
jgi:signal transduction histidine kinase/ligand-binding sensor domain-containing protein